MHFSHHSLFFLMCRPPSSSTFFFFNDTATTEIYTLSLHDALPIYQQKFVPFHKPKVFRHKWSSPSSLSAAQVILQDRKSTRLNSSHLGISYAVFCLKKKKTSHKVIHALRQRSNSYSRLRHAVHIGL